MPEITLIVTNPDGTGVWRTFPETSMVARMERGRAEWLANHGLLLPDGSIQPGVYDAQHLAPLIARPDEDWKIEKMLAVGQSKAWVRSLVDRAWGMAEGMQGDTGLTDDQIAKGILRWRGIIEAWPYGQTLQPIPHPTTERSDSPASKWPIILTEARVREIVRDELNKQSKEKYG